MDFTQIIEVLIFLQIFVSTNKPPYFVERASVRISGSATDSCFMEVGAASPVAQLERVRYAEARIAGSTPAGAARHSILASASRLLASAS